MDLKEHFESRHGIGVLSTADAEGPKFPVTFAVEKVLPLVGAAGG